MSLYCTLSVGEKEWCGAFLHVSHPQCISAHKPCSKCQYFPFFAERFIWTSEPTFPMWTSGHKGLGSAPVTASTNTHKAWENQHLSSLILCGVEWMDYAPVAAPSGKLLVITLFSSSLSHSPAGVSWDGNPTKLCLYHVHVFTWTEER